MDDPEVMERELNQLGKLFAERFNKMAWALERGKYEGYAQLPSLKDLDELDQFGRTLTTGTTFRRAPAPDRASLAEVRCLISDAVMHARALDYNEAQAAMNSALNKLMRVRDRKRTKALAPEIESALFEAAQMLVDIAIMFDAAEKTFAQEVHDGDASHVR